MGVPHTSAEPATHSGHSERGSSLVEFALVVPMLVLLLLGSVEFRLARYRLQAVHAASRDAARIGSYPTTSLDQIENRALASLSSASLEQTPTITVLPAQPLPCDGETEAIVVEISVDEPLLVPFWKNATVTLASRSEFLCER